MSKVTSNQTMRAVIAGVLVIALTWQIVNGVTVNDVLLSLLSLILGYYFGENAPVPER